MQQTASGVLATVEPRQAGWMRFHLSIPGKQYPLKVDTKRPDIVSQAQALMGQQVLIQYSEEESQKINPNTGRPYMERRLEQIVPVGLQPMVPQSTYIPPPASTAPAVRPQAATYEQTEPTGSPTFIRRVTWLSAASTAATLLQPFAAKVNTAQEVANLGPTLFAMANAIYAKAREVERGSMDGNHAQVVPQQEPQGHEQPPPPTDDDIPF